jgi:hypothetical protein
MKSKHIVSLLIAISASVAAPAFASGYGPSPFYNPTVGAPASQRGQDVQTVAAERASAGYAADSQSGYGGVTSASQQSGERVIRGPLDRLFARH